jgi:anti-sigma regulatory factor (Ser/Thr protein kinase)
MKNEWAKETNFLEVERIVTRGCGWEGMEEMMDTVRCKR